MAVIAGTGTISVGFNQTVSTGVVQAQTIPAGISLTTQYGNGTAAGKVDLIYAKQLTFVASTPQTLDLSALTDLSGAAANFARVREFLIQILTGTAGFDLTVGSAASNAWAALLGATGTTKAFAGIITYLLSDPVSIGAGVGAVVSGTSKNIKLDPGANALTANIIICGCSAVS